jgi:hypothetical protein
MNNTTEKNTQYSDFSYATVPTKWTLFWRHSLIYQSILFFIIALKVMRIVVGGHS